MACLAGGRELGCGMIGIGCLVIIGEVTANTSVGGIIIITVMAYRAIVCQGNVCACDDVIIIMDREGCRCPVRIRRMAGCAGSRNVDGRMIRVRRGIIVRHMAALAGVGGIGVITLVAYKAIGRDGGMGARERVNIVVIEC